MIDKPYTICHICSSVDARISGSYMQTQSSVQAVMNYAKIRKEYQAQAWLYGTITSKEFCPYRFDSKDHKTKMEDLTDNIVKSPLSFYYVSIDPKGEIKWDSPTFIRSNCPDAHVIQVLLEGVSKEYCDYLKETGVSYIFAGKESLDCALLKQKLSKYFGIQKLLVCGGGSIDWTFLEQKEVDELSMVVAPSASGEINCPTILDRSDYSKSKSAIELSLKRVDILNKDVLHIIYTPKNKGNH